MYLYQDDVSREFQVLVGQEQLKTYMEKARYRSVGEMVVDWIHMREGLITDADPEQYLLVIEVRVEDI